jgi:ribosome recycling factor
MYEEKTVADLEENLRLLKAAEQMHNSFKWGYQIVAKDTMYTLQSLSDRGLITEDEAEEYKNSLESLLDAMEL